MLKKNKSKGSAHVIIITIIVVALAGVVGYLGWSALQNKNNPSTASTTSETPKEEKPTPSPTVPVESNVVKLDNWGVKFTLKESLLSTQVKYYARATADTPPQEYYGFSTDRVEALGGECVKEPFGMIAILQRFNEKPVATPDGELVNESPIGDYYYVVTSPIAPCQPGSEVESQDRVALKQSLKTLELAN